MTVPDPERISNPVSSKNLKSSVLPTVGRIEPAISMPDWLMFSVVTSTKSGSLANRHMTAWTRAARAARGRSAAVSAPAGAGEAADPEEDPAGDPPDDRLEVGSIFHPSSADR